jgi:formate/nitrite transporter FocA (FNT family)
MHTHTQRDKGLLFSALQSMTTNNSWHALVHISITNTASSRAFSRGLPANWKVKIMVKMLMMMVVEVVVMMIVLICFSDNRSCQ